MKDTANWGCLVRGSEYAVVNVVIDLFVQACNPKKPATKSITTTTPMM